MNELRALYKPIGQTPLQAITHLRQTHPEYMNQKIGYAGRLDPMAHGVMLLMIGEATKQRDAYLSLTKDYTFEVLFGLETDTYDVLGLLRETTQQTIPSNVNVIVNTFVKNHIGKQKQDYPPYSSKTVQGKPLFLWAKEGRLDHITIPTRSIEIMKFDVLSFDALSKEALQHKIITNIGSLKGDFRQELILKRWETFFQKTSQQSFMTAKFHIACSSGTYVRGFVHELGALLGCGAVTIDILRTRAGNFRLDDLSNA